MLRTYTNRVSQYYQQRDEAVDQLGQPVSGCALPKILLIVEDEVNIANTYHRVFSRQGLEVLTALSTAEARDLLAKERVDIVVMDINMPEIDGAVLFQAPGCVETALGITTLASLATAGGVIYLVVKVLD